ncbi:MAG TPA: citryl-CoA lyase [candidate division Zixibacteria bacterium]|nr:citryl-CoA lyase [candidate division Zixibacteria bacterium]MDD4917063.1 citryl-CoA lyase [candidate division Zixibacteria bacterium]MDM7972955.1 citryl-CoA lyase [candidate division Zixibacteria bacterium]HOD65289.1 citryl-CoA lyase [candidate division Zixibacteria bacterium]HPM36230.1 citryl-CoA lyase [candidate division Zixibacteria bacterium]
MPEETWSTAITDIAPGRIRVRGYAITDIMEKLSYAEAVFLILKGQLPSPAEAELMNAVLVSSIDHGASPPSVLGARTVLSGGNSLNAAVAGGVLVIGDTHGGAIEQSAKLLQEWAAKSGDVETLAGELANWLKVNKMRMPGFGHRLHNIDPRTGKLFALADRHGYRGRHIDLCRAIEKALAEKLGKELPINVDGAIAAVISDMGFDWRLGKGFFIISRVPGLVAHVYEEMTREKPMRRLGPPPFKYDGPPDRDIP